MTDIADVLPLEYSNKILNHFDITSESERDMDISQLYKLYRFDYNLLSLAPDAGTKMFTWIFNRTEYQMFEILFESIISSNPEYNLYHIKATNITNDGNDTITIDGIQMYSYVRKKVVVKNLKTNSHINAEKNLIFLEYNDNNDFGHYGGFKYVKSSNQLDLFDSMMVSTKYEKSGSYEINFRNIVYAVFPEIENANVNIDISYTPDIFSLEITGGLFEVPNTFINQMDILSTYIGQNKYFNIDSYILGVDSQNQYCYMWTILYLISKTQVNPLEFQELYLNIFNMNLLPIVVIKIFCYLLVTKFKPSNINKTSIKQYNDNIELLLSDGIFSYLYKFISTNNMLYTECFKNENDTFNLYEINLDEIVDPYSETPNLNELFNHLKNIINSIIVCYANKNMDDKKHNLYCDLLAQDTIDKHLIVTKSSDVSDKLNTSEIIMFDLLIKSSNYTSNLDITNFTQHNIKNINLEIEKYPEYFIDLFGYISQLSGIRLIPYKINEFVNLENYLTNKNPAHLSYDTYRKYVLSIRKKRSGSISEKEHARRKRIKL